MNAGREIIPIFFASDDKYLPYLAVTVKSISDFASDEYIYDVKILTDGITEESLDKIRSSVKENVIVSAVDVNAAIAKSRDRLRIRLRDYYSETIYYRLYIASLFPTLKKAIYIDCDLLLKDDIAKLYFTDLGDNIIGAVADESIPRVPSFSDYVRHWVGKEPYEYVNSGVLVLDLVRFRKHRIAEKFTELVDKYNFETVAPDQDYINFLCHGRIKYLPAGWNKQPSADFTLPDGEIHLIHYNFYNKPWHFSGVIYEEEFWRVCDRTPFAEQIRRDFENYTDCERERDRIGGERLISLAGEISVKEGGFRQTLADSYYVKE